MLLEQADRIVNGALAKGRELKLAPLTVAVLDAGGHIKVLKRDDGASLLRPEIAIGKAWGVLGMGFGGRELARRAERMPGFFTALNAMSDGRMVALPGGVLIHDA
ncbi:heme-binding protein, partial [bacterium]|nr:heme-binding protein [bacterium]